MGPLNVFLIPSLISVTTSVKRWQGLHDDVLFLKPYKRYLIEITPENEHERDLNSFIHI